MEDLRKFAFAVQSTGKRTAKTTDPELTLATTEGKVKINEAASRLLGVQAGDHLMFLSNKGSIDAAVAAGEIEEGDVQPTYGIAKGNVIYDKSGRPQQVSKRLSNSEKEAMIEAGEIDDEGNPLPKFEDKKAGFKLSSSSNSVGIGVILDGSDAVNWNDLGGNKEKLVVYSILKEAQEVVVPNGTDEGETVMMFVIEQDRTESKSR